MKKIFIGLGISALLFLLLATAFAFSVTLQNLHVSALSFAQPVSAAVIEVPMTSADEANIASPSSDSVRFGEMEQETRVCQKDKDRATDF